MASTSEDLTAQAAQLQEAIAFFKVETENRTRLQNRSLPQPAVQAKLPSLREKGVKLSLPVGAEGDLERY